MWCGLRLRPNFGEGPAIQKVWPRKMDTFRTRWSWTASRWNAAGHSTLGVDGRRHKQPKRRLCLKKEKEKKEEILEDTERMTSWFVGGSDGRRWQFTEFYRVSSGCVCVCVCGRLKGQSRSMIGGRSTRRAIAVWITVQSIAGRTCFFFTFLGFFFFYRSTSFEWSGPGAPSSTGRGLAVDRWTFQRPPPTARRRETKYSNNETIRRSVRRPLAWG